MSWYRYYCNCGFEFEEERQIGTDHPDCPKCNGKYGEELFQDYGNQVLGHGFIPITAGIQSEINKKRIGQEQLQKLEEKNQKYSTIGARQIKKELEKHKNDFKNL